MAQKPQLLDRWGNPVRRQALTQEFAAPTIGGIRSPVAGYPGDGLNPVRLANVLRAADLGDPVNYLDLAETIEERDPHYLGVLATRKRSVSQIEVTVEAGSDDPADVKIADMVRAWLRRDELSEEVFHILDCIGKGYSFTEILWDSSEGQWEPRELKRRDPRHFRFARHDLETPLLIGDNGQEVALEPFHFIYANIPAKSGIALRSGLARVASWGWMFKAFTLRDWAIFTQTYGQPLRVGKWHSGATEEDKATLFRAVANIAGDCAAIIPDTMALEFVESKNVSSSSDHYEKRADWFDRQISKAVLGQTATTDAIAGGHAVGQEHRQVQEDIETADARALSAILNRDLIRPWVMLEYGPRKHYPRIVIARPKAEDIKGMSEALQKLVPLGLKVQMSEVRDRLGFSDPDLEAELLAPAKPADQGPPGTTAADATSHRNRDGVIERVSAIFKRGPDHSRAETALQTEGASTGKISGGDPVAVLTDRLALEADAGIRAMIDQLAVMLDRASSLDEFRAMVLAGFPDVDEGVLAAAVAQGLLVGDLAGRATTVEGNDA